MKTSLFKIFPAMLILLNALTICTAQSGRDVSRQKSAAEPTSTETPTSTTGKSDFVIDPNADKYKLVFPAEYRGTAGKITDFEKPAMTLTSSRESFVEELNKAGAQGYRFVAATNNFNAGLMKLGETQFEYRRFENESDNDYGAEVAGPDHEKMVEQGFRFVERFTLSGFCSTETNDWLLECEYRHVWLYEKEKGKKPPRYETVFHLERYNPNPDSNFAKKISAKTADGFLPVAALSPFLMLLEEAEDRDALENNPPEIETAMSLLWNRIFVKKVNALAQKGYRINIISNGIAVMSRRRGDGAPVKYVWVSAKKKNFEKNLAKLAAQGAIYKATYPNDDGRKKTLIFEVPQNSAGKKREYNLLRFEFEVKETSPGILSRSLTPESEKSLQKLNELAKQGFVARDIFNPDNVTVLLER